MSKLLKILASLFKNLAVVVAGLIIFLFLLEILLYIFGQSRQFLINQKNNNATEEEFVILALGESTTVPMRGGGGKDFSWPALLEDSLNLDPHLERKFKVINKGWSGINSTVILDELDENLEKYQPDLVISMMGINDYGVVEYEAAANIEKDDFKSKFRVYRLTKFLIANLKDKWNFQTLEPESESDCYSEGECINQAESLKDSSKLNLAKELWLKALEYNQTNAMALVNLGNYYLEQREMEKASEYFSLLEESHGENFDTFLDLGWFYLTSQEYQKAGVYFEKVLKKQPKNESAYSGLIYSLQGLTNPKPRFEEIWREVKEKEINSTGVFEALAELGQRLGYEKDVFYSELDFEAALEDPYALVSVARYYVQHEDYEKAEKIYLSLLEDEAVGSLVTVELDELYQKIGKTSALDKELENIYESNDKYASNYRLLHNKLKEKNIPLIAVQYPMRSIRPLELIFKNKEKPFLVDNEASFKEAVEREGYWSIFMDYFAGDFGHCTEKGNQLIVENIKPVIINNWAEISSGN